MSDVQQITDHVTGSATAGSGLFTIFSGLSENEIGIYAGIALTIFFGVVNVGLKYYFLNKHYQLAKQQSETTDNQTQGLDK